MFLRDMRRRREFLAVFGMAIPFVVAGCTGGDTVEDGDEGDVSVNDYWFEWEEREFGDDDVVFVVEVENQTDEDQTVNVEAELYEDDFLLDDVGPWINIPPNATTQEDRMFFDLDPDDVDRVTRYTIRASGLWDDPITVSEGSGDDFRADLG